VVVHFFCSPKYTLQICRTKLIDSQTESKLPLTRSVFFVAFGFEWAVFVKNWDCDSKEL